MLYVIITSVLSKTDVELHKQHRFLLKTDIAGNKTASINVVLLLATSVFKN